MKIDKSLWIGCASFVVGILLFLTLVITIFWPAPDDFSMPIWEYAFGIVLTIIIFICGWHTYQKTRNTRSLYFYNSSFLVGIILIGLIIDVIDLAFIPGRLIDYPAFFVVSYIITALIGFSLMINTHYLLQKANAQKGKKIRRTTYYLLLTGVVSLVVGFLLSGYDYVWAYAKTQNLEQVGFQTWLIYPIYFFITIFFFSFLISILLLPLDIIIGVKNRKKR